MGQVLLYVKGPLFISTFMKTYYVYIVECSDSSFYTGFTSNLEKRINEHNNGLHKEAYTYKRRPVILRWVEYFSDPNQAIMVEKQIKAGAGEKNWP